MMRRLLLPLAVTACLALSGCAGLGGGIGGVATPQRCEDALRNAATLEALAKLLPGFGVPAHDVDGISQALAQGRVSIQAVCDFARSQDATPDPSGNVT